MSKERPTRSGEAIPVTAEGAAMKAAQRLVQSGQYADCPALGAAQKAVAAGDLDRARGIERAEEARAKAESARANMPYPGRKGTA